jgi:ABC-type multidrug transport system permease subunit
MKKYWILITAAVLIIAGLILQFVYGGMFSAGDYCCNYFAAGDYSVGVFAAGRFSLGVFSAGIFSAGIFSIGIFNIALYAVGFFLIAWKKRKSKIDKSGVS